MQLYFLQTTRTQFQRQILNFCVFLIAPVMISCWKGLREVISYVKFWCWLLNEHYEELNATSKFFTFVLKDLLLTASSRSPRPRYFDGALPFFLLSWSMLLLYFSASILQFMSSVNASRQEHWDTDRTNLSSLTKETKCSGLSWWN